ncbi:hypothetical protein Poli38472_012220 [Pythium oligandrum]|uniref:RRM domain-containing protein n=1 Tax=Pythium oligandrum TaxID=41045 RepID=A0A8K1CP94_PYTOL|nr:hypothetical protein Poli38472_012220 [Pythium oligandrum]|eukprot:TMW67104.1 hypothetical protein Poli38472_012220 [Pythium oligandrum]
MSATVFVRNLPFDVTQDALEQVFGEIGPVKKVDVIKDKGKKKSETTTRGFAFVRFAMAADAQYAIEKLHQSDFRGRKMILEIAKEKVDKRKKAAPAPVVKEEVAPVEEEQVAEPEQVEEAPVKKEKKEKKEKKAKKEKKEEVEEEVAPQEEKTEKKKKDKKAKKEKKEVKVEEPEAMEEAEPMEQEETPVEANATGHVQSERNARRRMHREFLRQVEARKETSASTEEKSLLVYGLGADVTQKALFKKIKKIASVSKVELKEEEKTNKKYAIVQLEFLKDVDTAILKLDRHIFKGATLKVMRLQAAQQDAKNAGEGLRLIVRNLSFQTTDADLEKLFGQCGELAEARVVRLALEDPDNAPEGAVGKSRGFGFVQFRDGQDARSAIEKWNGYKLKGREMIVDFALSKAKYLQQQKEQENANGDEAEDMETETPEGEEVEDDDEKEEVESDIEDVDLDAENEDEDDDEEDDDEEEEEEEENKPQVHKEDSDEQRARTIFLRNLSFQSTEEGLRDFFATYGPVEYARIVYDKGSGLSKGVAFVRFKQREVADLVIERSQSALARQEEQEKNKKKKKKQQEDPFALSALADGDALMLDGRMLLVSRSVNKDDADRLTEANSADRKKRDKRNMYLAYEGTISVNKLSEEELGLPKLDIEKRRRAIREKKEKLKNPLIFVSPVRLSVRNLATSVDDKQLKQIFRDAAATGIKEGKVIMKDVKSDFVPTVTPPEKAQVKVKMAKVVRDMENVKPGKEPRSRGYGFVEFTEHIHALAALRVLNNNPQFTKVAAGGAAAAAKVKQGKSLADEDKSRLIVEFALENHGKLKLREKKQQDASKKREEERALKEAQGDDDEGKKQKKSRGQRQREQKKQQKDQPKEEKKPQPKKAKAAEPQRPQQKKRQRPEGDDLEQLASMEGGVMQQNGEKKSRKQRKQAKEMQQERSFEALVRDYKKEIFGGKSSKTGSSEAQDRWFD